MCLLLVSIFIIPIFQDVAFAQTDTPDAKVRQLLGRTGEIVDAESATEKIVIIRTTK